MIKPGSEKAVEVSRGMPSVNESIGKKKSNKAAIILFVALVVGVGGGAAFWMSEKLKGAAKAATTPGKPSPDQQVAKTRTFGEPEQPAPLTPSAGSVPAQGGGVAAGTPPQPAPLGGAQVGAGRAGPGVAVPALGGTPDAPPPIPVNATNDGSSQRRKGAGAGTANRGALGEVGDYHETNPYDSKFVVNGGIQPGSAGAAHADDPFDAVIAKGKAVLAGAGVDQSANRAAVAEAGQDGGKGALTGMLTPTMTPMVRAIKVGDPNLTVRKGTPLECILSTRIVAMLPGLVRCRLTSPLYSENGKVILADRGSELVGEQTGAMRQGQTRLYVLWSELNTPEFVTIPIDSPGTDQLGAAGVDGTIDNHWSERIGAALLLSVVEDAFAYEIAKQGANSASTGAATTSGVAFQSTQQTGQGIAGKVLDSTINIPPTLYKQQGDKISITIARNLDFSTVYELRKK